MKDEILKSFLGNFVEQHGLEEKEDFESFEDFVNFNVISKLYPREINLENISTGGENDIALDGAAIIVNGNIINDESEVDYFIKKNGTLNVTFALIQSKSSAKFSGEQIGNFIFGVKSLFDDRPSIPENDKIKNLRRIKEKVYKESIHFEENPSLKLFFVTTGHWKEPEQIIGKVQRELQELDAKSLFVNSAEIEFFDAERLKETYRENSRKIVKEIPFNNHVALPDMPDELMVRQSFIGSISVKNYLDLITNSDKKLSKGLFYDNVRDFQGNNKVNREIQETIRSHTNQSLLSLMNNGITIIAKKVEKIGSKMKLTDFQIVNGCQSSHVLFKNKSSLSEDTHIVLKVIETIDQEITNKIIRATNRQTEVKDEAFESLKPFHKDLQELYKAKSSTVTPPIFYERRSKEYMGSPHIKSCQIITLASQVKDFVATHLAQPQSTHRYFGEILDSNKSKLFKNKNDLKGYYLSALIVNRIERYLRYNKNKYKPFKYHSALLVYRMIRKKKSKNYGVSEMIVAASDFNNLKILITKSTEIIETELKKTNLNKMDAVRSKEFTGRLLSYV